MDLQKRVDQHDRDLAAHKKRMEKIEKDLGITAKLVKVGMKLIIEDRRRQKESREEFDYQLKALIASQQRTDAKLDRLADMLLRRNRNGHSSS